ncbi:Uncharacterized protein Adt_41054 [Abeliophyllum distichum]|uniref:Tf2-1-like SH3-like domain-containing protein n=1 Tax=Abeliophyllum distichum TaxID=126358 RepID=A0ABD1PPA3_9LAMI
MRKERFPARQCSKLHPRGDGPFQVLERINNNAYKLDLPGNFNVSTTFNISDHSPFDVGDDSRSNLFKEEGDDASHEPDANHGSVNHDPTRIPIGTLTRSRAKKVKEDIQGLVKTLWADADIKNMSLTNKIPTWIHLIQAKEGMEGQFGDKAKLEQDGQHCDRMVINPCDRNTADSEAEHN